MRSRRKESPRRRKARNAGDVYRHPRAIYACVSSSHKSFASQNVFWEPYPMSLSCVRGEKALSCLSGFPQNSRSEFCGKRSGRHIRSCGKRSAPQTKTPCRDEVGKRAADQNALPRRGGLFATCELGNFPLWGNFLTEAAFSLRRRDGGLTKARRRGC